MNCTIKKGASVKGGYIKQSYNGRRSLAHRVSYCRANGMSLEDIDGKVVLHSCDNPPCVNPQHLSLGTSDDNMRDMVVKVRGRGPKRRQLTDDQAKLIRYSAHPYEQGAAYGVSKQVVGFILRGKTYKHAI